MISEEVLIIGGGLAGLTTAVTLAEAGISSALIERSGDFGGRLRSSGMAAPDVLGGLLRKAENSEKVSLLSGTELARVSGIAGDFTCTLRTGQAEKKAQFGAIVLATGSAVRARNGMKSLQLLQNPPEKAGCVCAILSPGDSSSVVQTEMTLTGAVKLRDGGVQVSILYQQMKVAAPGLQPLYDRARDAGVVFARYCDFPSVTKANGGYKVEFTVEDLAERVQLSCDLVVGEGEEVPSPGAEELAGMLDLDTDAAAFFQSENPALYPVSTRRRGILAVGACRKPSTMEDVLSDACSAAEQVSGLFATLRKGPPVEAPSVDKEKCAFCLTCYRACPHRAIGFDYENRAAKILENACYACGVCVVECPARAITFERQGVQDNALEGKIAAFFCRHSAAPAMEKLREQDLEVPPIVVEEVECSGRIEIPTVLEAFRRGATGVIMAGCHKGSCRSLTGSHYALQRSERLRSILQQAGRNPASLEMVFISDIEPAELARTLREFAQRLEDTPKGD